ncbi:hypothetical protein NIES267_68900 [Calothrix parasitica NIES-267]|uniref:Uncharacterized protein n=1 Tax=Calothrix parasitica NIES-267 TaxID=1973488 RepID=A0A1Z4M1W6_9CYAN|nr:hypothetical protein NIES267_68900 [Calothrix parasitica NIES-267]
MSKASELEIAIANAAKAGDALPKILPNWMLNLGILPGNLITSSERIGNKSTTTKTDVLIKLRESPPLKISAKLSNADYFGNWYGHKRFIKEFGYEAFYKMTNKVTEWANNWVQNPNASLFVGVSISFGYRTGNTSIEFLQVFNNIDELKKVIAGVGNGDEVANCLYVSDQYPQNIEQIIENLSPFDNQSISAQSKKIKIVCRPVNPMTERSNRGKNVYTRFQPYQALKNKTSVNTLEALIKLGKFIIVEPEKLNHNKILNDLESNYNILIPRKS